MTAPTEHRTAPTQSAVGPIVGAVIGVPILAFGIWGLLHDSDMTHPPDFAVWFVGVNVVADLVLLPVLIGAGFVLTRPLPTWAQPTVRLGVAVSAVLTLVAWPVIGGFGDDPTTPSLLPRDELAGLLSYLGVVWASVAVVLVRRRLARRAISGRGEGG